MKQSVHTSSIRSTRPGVAIYATLRQEILELTLQPNTVLDETELGRRFGTSRSPVREALARLSTEGLVKTLPNRSSIVSNFDLADISGYFTSLDLIYRAAARLAAVVATPQDIAAIKAAAQAHADAARQHDSAAVVRFNRAFHVAIARASGNPWYESWTSELFDTGERILRLYVRQFSSEPAERFLGTHDAIFEAIERGDPAAAEYAAGEDAAYLAERLRPVIMGQIGGRASAAPSWNGKV